MFSKLDLNTLLDQTFFGLDILTMLGDVEEFIGFSEQNIGWQKHRELERVKRECNDVAPDDPHLGAQYRDQMMNGVEYRFEVSLTQRVRYSALVALITTIEWVLQSRVEFEFPPTPKGKSESVHALAVFVEKASVGLDQKTDLLESLIKVRNCIVHAAGLLESYRHGPQLCSMLNGLSGINVSDRNLLGMSVEIEAGFLEGVIADMRGWLPDLERALSERNLLRG